MHTNHNEPLGVAFIGAGIVAEMHGRGITATPNALLRGVYDVRSEKARAVAKKFGARVYHSLDEALQDPQVQAVHVLTPTESHVAIPLEALERGKHVLVEKPVAATVPELRRLQEAARQHQRVCMPAHNYIYLPDLERAKRLLTQGKLGQVAALWILYNVFHSEAVAATYGGVLRAVCIHHAYSLLYLLGRPTRVSALVSRLHYRQLDCEDQASITCEMPDQSIAHLWCSFAANDPTSDPWTVVYKVLGTRGGVTYSWNQAQFDDQGGPAWGLPCYEDGFRGEIDHFLNRVIRKGERPLSTLDDAIDALRILEAAERAALSGKREPVLYAAEAPTALPGDGAHRDHQPPHYAPQSSPA